MKKIICIIIMLSLSVCVVSGCSSTVGKADGRLSIVATIFPEYDWVKEILGNKVDDCDLTLLLDNGVDLHSYQPTADDIIKISSCDVFIFVGGESDAWADNVLKKATNKEMIVINLLDALGDSVKEEEVINGMQSEKEEQETEEMEYDEHVWLSLKNAAKLCETISVKLCSVDSENAGIYKQNAAAYIEKLNDLDARFAAAVNNAKVKTLLFGDRFPFRYLVDDYGLDYYAAFVGCSAESEADFETVSFLSKKIDELNLPAVLTLEGSEHKIAETVIANTKNKNQRILSMDSMQSTTSADVRDGATYLSVMEKNLNVLKQALN